MVALRRFLLTSESALLFVAILVLGSLALWIGVPLGWLWVGSKLQALTESLSVAIGTMMLGMVATIAGLIGVLTWLNRRHIEVRAARGREVSGATTLEHTLVASAALAVVAYSVWFFGFSGSSPIPLNIGY
jgi:heme/copper-type cytochrome/quinol oxidase subunit 2